MRKRTNDAMGDKADEGSSGPSALVRGLNILRSFRPSDETLGNQDFLDRTGLPKATVSRLTSTLLGLGYLEYDQVLGRYRLGPSTISLGYTALSANAVIHTARPLMQSLADQTGLAVAMGVRDGLEMMYILNCRSEHPVTLRLNVGSRLPIWCTAMGEAYMAGMLEPARQDLLERLALSEPARVADIERSAASAMAAYARDGFIVSEGDWRSYISAVGIPFRPTDGSQLVAITCGGLRDFATHDALYCSFGPALRALAQELQRRLTGVALTS